MGLKVAVLDYEMSNLRSVAKALERLGATVAIARTPGETAGAEALVLPGDGHFGEAMRRIRDSGLNQAVVEAAGRRVPILGICIGMQVLFEESDEAPGVAGLGLLGGRVRKLETRGKIPHIGWARVRWSEGSPLATNDPGDTSTYYFLHSYAVEPAGGTACWGAAEHGAPFCAVAAEGSIIGVQFHPEKSSRSGLALLKGWMAHVTSSVPA